MMEDQQLKRFADALDYATRKHAGQYRHGGEDYITHPIAVAAYLKEKDYDLAHQITALFHDLLEDTDATPAEILQLGGEEVLEAVKLLTKPINCNMADYVAGIKSNPMAKAVKTADRLHNLRCAVNSPEPFRRRYVAESKLWYADFGEEIVQATHDLEKTL